MGIVKHSKEKIMVSGESIQYQIRPSHEERFKKTEIEELVRNLIVEKLDNVEFDVKLSAGVTKELAQEIQEVLRELKMSPRYKFIVSINYGENQGQHFSYGLRTLWDSDSDKHQNINFKNDTIFCTVDIFGIYHY